MDAETKLATIREMFNQLSVMKQSLSDMRIELTFRNADVTNSEQINLDLGDAVTKLSDAAALLGREIDVLEKNR